MSENTPVILPFSEPKEARGLPPTRRVNRLGPQIRGYRKIGMPWYVIKQSLEEIEIRLSIQVMKNCLQCSDNQSVTMPTLTTRGDVAKNAFRSFRPRPKDY